MLKYITENTFYLYLETPVPGPKNRFLFKKNHKPQKFRSGEEIGHFS